MHEQPQVCVYAILDFLKSDILIVDASKRQSYDCDGTRTCKKHQSNKEDSGKAFVFAQLRCNMTGIFYGPV